VLVFSGVAAAALSLVGGWFAHEYLGEWVSRYRSGPADGGPKDDHAHAAIDRVRLSPQARDNLRLLVKPVEPQTYSRTVEVRGTVVERRGRSDRGVIAPAAGVVKRIAAVPGDAVEHEAELFTLTLTSETLQISQTELLKAVEELRINLAEQKRLESAKGAVPEA